MFWDALRSIQILQRTIQVKAYTYLLIDLACISIPFIASFYKPYPFYKKWRYFLPANFIVALLFLIWDALFTKWGIWGFNEDYLIGFNIFNLPLEEVLFFLCIPYACTFTFFSLEYLIPKLSFESFGRILKWIFLGITVAMMIFGWGKYYTFTTGFLTFCLMLYVIIQRIEFSYIFLAYFLIIPFFLASNGILTGSLVEAPIVWYNDAQNLGQRFITIPLEDFIYGFLLIAANILLMRFFESGKFNRGIALDKSLSISEAHS